MFCNQQPRFASATIILNKSENDNPPPKALTP